MEFDKTEYEGDGREETSPYGIVSCFSSKEKWYKDLGGHVTYLAYWYDVPEGKYLLTVTGFARKEEFIHWLPKKQSGIVWTLKKEEDRLIVINQKQCEF